MRKDARKTLAFLGFSAFAESQRIAGLPKIKAWGKSRVVLLLHFCAAAEAA